MKIIKTQVLSGPNIWCSYREKLIQMRIDLEDMESYSAEQIESFSSQLESMFPKIITTGCAATVNYTFFKIADRFTWIGPLIEHIALELQSLGGFDTSYGCIKSTNTKGIYNIVFEYEFEEAGLYAAEAAVRIINTLSNNEQYDVNPDIEYIRDIKRKRSLGPSTQCIVKAAIERNIPWSRQDTGSSILLGYGVCQKKIRATITGNTSSFGVNIAGDKDFTKQLLSKARIPVAEGSVCSTDEGLKEIIDEIGYPIVIKPLDGNQGKGASINVQQFDNATAALALAKNYSQYAVVERYIEGNDYRLLVIDNKFVAASKRVQAHIIGDGTSSIQQLLDATNANPKRGSGHECVLTKINLDDDSYKLLADNNYTLESIVPKGTTVFLKSTANLSTGGTAIDVTDKVHPENRFMAERISKIIGLDICGIDVMTTDITIPLKESKGVVIEVNAAPGFRMHTHPAEGKPRNVGKAVIDMLFPPDKPTRIPIIAITGTNGKTTTTRLTAHVAKMAGHTPGYTTTDGIYIGNHKIDDGDMTGPISAKAVLQDPTVDFAVLETARGGLLRSGLSFSQCDIGIITNIKEDHLGLNDIETIHNLAQVKAVVAKSVKDNGWAILNAEDEECVKIASELKCNVAFFSLNENNENIQNHIKSKKPVAVLENGFITIIKGNDKIRLEQTKNIPLTLEGKCSFMIANVLASSLASYMWGFTTKQIKEALNTFIPSVEQTPGRLNLFEFNDFKVLVDYAHNPHGFLALNDYLTQIEATRKVGIIAGIGDRRAEDIMELGKLAAEMFDHIIIRQEHSLRGRTEKEINDLLIEGIHKAGKETTYTIVNDEVGSIKYALSIAQKGDLIVALSDTYKDVIAVITEELNNEKNIIPVDSTPEIGTIAS
ncbi:MAG: cyanophycin synthetase [Bacteroidota bacterium]